MVDPTPQTLDGVRAEALKRCAAPQAAGAALPPRAALQEILDIITVEPEAFSYAMNELRGFFFAQLTVEFDSLLQSRFNGGMNEALRGMNDGMRRALGAGGSRSHRPSDILEYREPEFITEAMRSLLEELSRVADVFARSFLLVVEDIPRVFGMALKLARQAAGQILHFLFLSAYYVFTF